jgi:hypothetical protein
VVAAAGRRSEGAAARRAAACARRRAVACSRRRGAARRCTVILSLLYARIAGATYPPLASRGELTILADVPVRAAG